jgi:uncharacterized membrane protein
MLSIAGVYTLGRGIFNRRIGFLSALVVTLSPFHVAYSQELRMYTLAFLSTTLTIYFFFKALFSPSMGNRRYWVFYALSTTMGLYTHYVTGFVLVILFLLGSVRSLFQGNLRALWLSLLAHTAVALSFAPWLPTMWAQFNKPRIMWVPNTTVQRMFRQFTRLYLYDVHPEGLFLPLAVSAFALLLVGMLLWPRGGDPGPRRDSLERYRFALGSGVGPAGALFLVSLFKPMLVDRYVFAIAPAIFVLLALGSDFFLAHRATAVVPLVFGAVLAISTWGVLTTDLKTDWRGVVEYISARSALGDVVVLVPDYMEPVLTTYYDVHLAPYGIPRQLDAESAQRVLDDLEGVERAWVVMTGSRRRNVGFVEYIEPELSARLVSCQEIGDTSPVSVCLYE